MRFLRASFRLVAVCCVTGGFYFCWLAGAPFAAFYSRRPGGDGATWRWRHRNCRGWARSLARILGVRISVRNAPPCSPFLLVSNHLSYIDVIVLASQLDCAFIAKSEVARWPIVGVICRSMNTIFVDRTLKRDVVRVMNEIANTIASGAGVVLFAEGTSSSGQSVLPFRSALLEFAAQRQLPVHYASLNYSVPRGEPAVDQSVCWWGDMTFTDHFFRLLQLPRFEATLTFGEQPVIAGNRRVLAAELWTAVNSQFSPITTTY